MVVTPRLTDEDEAASMVRFHEAHPLDAASRALFRSGREVHVWYAATDAPTSVMSNLSCLLSPEEQLRAFRFKYAQDQSRYIISHALLRLLLSAYTEIAPSELTLESTKHGKPYLAARLEHKRIQFNITHSNDTFCCVLSKDWEVGVDVEQIRKDFDWFSIAQSYFSPMEAAQLEATPVDGQASAFYKLWTRKEALLKAIGTGFTGIGGLADHRDVHSMSSYALHSFQWSPDYQGAVAVNSSVPRAVFFHYPDLIRQLLIP
ncbi:4'-phosphopantetheinyl transferase family protein [Paenibacillus cremeus]|uniref:4'-phosphopantetheinyl transferase superfamily protein n=1 Tax=Paenibacillus cremeus TaxID=2163881 RepID=A0A559K3Z5_9BACL|nr:4'-phosphopantetheinyl transferase superfamily protein [Paenibacillus cremeus]TVY06836.1 4'-phosphopantetheinyl transferase superfamily protein [Paenibacillus cremeus]